MEILDRATRVPFFSGKGGVGKTSIACATAVKLADSGSRVLLISTHPASNLDEVLGVRLGTVPTAIPGVPQLMAMNIDPEAPWSDCPPDFLRGLEHELDVRFGIDHVTVQIEAVLDRACVRSAPGAV